MKLTLEEVTYYSQPHCDIKRTSQYFQLTLSSRIILWLCWGRRETYPKSVTATPTMWLRWFLEMPWFFEPYWYEAKRNHGSRQKRKKKRKEELASKKGNPMNDLIQTDKTPAFTDAEIEALMATKTLEDGDVFQTNEDYEGVEPTIH